MCPVGFPAAKSDNRQKNWKPQLASCRGRWGEVERGHAGDPRPRRSGGAHALICNTGHQSCPQPAEAEITALTHCDLWDVLFSLIRHCWSALVVNAPTETVIPSARMLQRPSPGWELRGMVGAPSARCKVLLGLRRLRFTQPGPSLR